MRKNIESFKTEESKKIQSEDKEMAELQALMEKLKERKLKREMNIAAYDKKLVEIDEEVKAWEVQRANLDKLNKTIDEKIQVAENERNSWKNKMNSYQQEAEKWQKESKIAEKTYRKYDFLNK